MTTKISFLLLLSNGELLIIQSANRFSFQRFKHLASRFSFLSFFFTEILKIIGDIFDGLNKLQIPISTTRLLLNYIRIINRFR